jgi:hypothetical protein
VTYGLWVRHGEVEDHLRLGWVVCVPERLCSHDFWSVFCVWLCDCPLRRPE